MYICVCVLLAAFAFSDEGMRMCTSRHMLRQTHNIPMDSAGLDMKQEAVQTFIDN